MLGLRKKKSKKCKIIVLILILLEVGLLDGMDRSLPVAFSCVLILILLEVGLLAIVKFSFEVRLKES